MNPVPKSLVVMREKLKALRRRWLRVKIAENLVGFWLAYGLALLAAVVLEGLFGFSSPVRTGLVSALLVLGLFLLVYHFVIPLLIPVLIKHHPGPGYLARQVGNAYPQIKDRFLNTWQLLGRSGKKREGYAEELVGAAAGEVAQALEPVNIKEVFTGERIKKLGIWGTILIVLGITLFFSFPNALGSAAHRLVHFREAFLSPLPFELAVWPGDDTIIEGDTLTVEVRAVGASVKGVWLRTREEGQEGFGEPIPLSERGERFAYTFAGLHRSFDYFVESGPVTSEAFGIEVHRRPVITELKLTFSYPLYSGLGTRRGEENVGDFSALKGTRVKFTVSASKELKAAWLAAEGAAGKRRHHMKLWGSRALGELTITEDFDYHFDLLDRSDVANTNPINYRARVLPDESPLVRLFRPERDGIITEAMKIALAAEAIDDFGISGMNLNYRALSFLDSVGTVTPDSGVVMGLYEKISLPFHQEGERALADYIWDLTPLGLLPEDGVAFFVEAFDNDLVSGPKRGTSKVITFRFPSLFEMYAGINQYQDEGLVDLREIVEESEQLQKRLEEITEELKKNPQLDWQKKSNIEESISQQKDMIERLDQLTRQMDQLVEKMEQSLLFSEETLDKYHQLQELMREISSPDLEEALRKLGEALKQQDPSSLRRALENFQMTEEDFRKSLEKTLSLLERLRLEQRLQELVKKAEALASEQERVNEALGDITDEDQDELAAQVRRMARDMEKLQSDIKGAEAMTDEKWPQAAQKLGKADSLLSDQQVGRKMEQLGTMIATGQASQAGSLGEGVEGSLKEMTDLLKQAQQALISAMQAEIASGLKRTAYDLLALSGHQESLMHTGGQAPETSPRMGELMVQQQGLRVYLSHLSEEILKLSQKTFFVTPDILASLGRAGQGMGMALNSYQRRNARGAAQNQRRAMGALNQAAQGVNRALENLASASSATGLSEYLKQLEKLAGQQAGLNQQTMLVLGEGGKLTLQQQVAMARLAASQDALRKSLEQLRKEMGEGRGVLGDLGEIGRQMGEVSEDLRRGRNRERMHRTQQRILSRLLDAQRSLHQQGKSRKRLSRIGREIERPSPLPLSLKEEKDQLREELLQALKEGYTEDYQRLIKAYFDALQDQLRAGQEERPFRNVH